MCLHAKPATGLTSNQCMEVEGLRLLITKALGSTVGSGADLSQALYEVKEGHEGRDPVLSDLIKALREVPALRLFNDMMHVVPNQAHRVDYDYLAAWLLHRARTLGTNEALRDYQHSRRQQRFRRGGCLR